jgi:hexosaminidase
MLDVSRHFSGKEFIFKFLDLMALHKLNTFHFHLCDNQGWRLEVKQFPKLTTIGGQRSSSPVIRDRNSQDGIPYGPYFYTQDDIREIVTYARQHAITVVPEIEMPGHCLAALAAYPEYSCTGGPFQVRTCSGYEENVYCAGKEATFTFLERVLDEVLDVFPSRVIHLGGDECLKNRWRECPDCQRRIREEGLHDENELQSYFMRRMARYLAHHGRRVMGWDEILDGGLPDDAAVMSWRGTEGGETAANMGHDVVMTPTTHCYFDYYQSEDQAHEPEAIGGFIPLEQVYSYDPAAGEFTESARQHIMGVQGNLWTEYMRSYRQVEYMTYPRAAALAEVAWTPQEARSYADFLHRLAVHNQRLDLLHVHYRHPRAHKLFQETH